MKDEPMPRPEYMDRILMYRDRPVIKVLVGIRRCGKSTLLMMLRDRLIADGVPERNIIRVNFSHRMPAISADDLYDAVASTDGRAYVLLDEVQEVEGWDGLVLSMLEDLDCDIYLTSSNSVMFASNLSTRLSGRSVTIEVFTFSYAEFLRFCGVADSDDAVREYMTYGGFPLALMVRDSRIAETQVIEGIYNTVVLKDIIQRNNLRNQATLERITGFLMRSIGSPVSANSIRNSLGSSGQKVNHETVDSYLGYLEESLAFYRAKRYDVKAKEGLVLNDKFYPADPGLRTASLGLRDADTGHVMEGVVYLELRRRGYDVRVGKVGDREIDFVAIRGTETMYIQVCHSITDPEVERREIRPFTDVRDNYRKVIVVMIPSLNRDRDGIEEITLREFLLGEDTEERARMM